MEMSAILQLLQTFGTIVAILVAIGTIKTRSADKTVELTTMAVDIKYIKEKMQSVDPIRDDLIKTTAAASSAHKRLDDHLKYDHEMRVEKRDD